MQDKHKPAMSQGHWLILAGAVFLLMALLRYDVVIVAGGVMMVAVGAELLRRSTRSQPGDKSERQAPPEK